MKIALFSDIHSNLPALEAVLSDIEQKKRIDAIYCLGDLVGYAPWPNEVIETIQSRQIPTIMGNYDYGVGQNSSDCGCAYKTEEDKKRGEQSIKFTNQLVTSGNRAFLKELPIHLRLEFGDPGNPQTILLVHGSPRKINEYLYEDRPDAGFLRMMKRAEAHIMAFGHTHKPYHKVIAGDGENRHAINIGSVGKPKDGDSRACYAILEWKDGLGTNQSDLSVSFIRVQYDVEKAAKGIENSSLPNAFAAMLREAY